MANIHINFTKFDSLIQIADFFSSEEICKKAIAQERWGDGAAVCPYCGSTHTHVCKDGRYICKGCQRKFSVTVGTIFENTKISLRKWFMAMYLISSHKKGVSSCQLARDLKVTQKTAWFILHKVRGLYGQNDSTVLKGTVEMDEMYLGGRETNKHESKRTEGTQGRSTKTKTPIFGMIDREKGTVVAMKVEDTKGATLMPIVSQFVEKDRPYNRVNQESWWFKRLTAVGERHGFSVRTPIGLLSDEAKQIILYGTGDEKYHVKLNNGYEYDSVYEGVIPNLERRHKETESEFIRKDIERFMREHVCQSCHGARLKPVSFSCDGT